MKLQITHEVSDYITLQLMARYFRNNNFKWGAKKDFMIYFRDQIELFGSDEESQIQGHYGINSDIKKQAKKWFNIIFT